MARIVEFPTGRTRTSPPAPAQDRLFARKLDRVRVTHPIVAAVI